MDKLENVLINHGKYIWLIILALSIPAIWALFVPGYYGASDDLHVAWLFEMDRVLKLGQFPPRFIPDLSYQFGYPLFNFVFPLPFYLGELFHLIGFNLVDSVKLIFLVTVPLSMYFMYKLMRQFTGLLLAMAGAVLYVYTPYRATDLYVRGAIGEIVGFVFLPLVCLSLLKVVNSEKKQQFRWIGIGALSIGGLVLTHDIMAYMFFPLVAVLGLLLIFLGGLSKRIFGYLILMGTLGLLVSIYFWLPAIMDSHLMKYDTVFNFIDHFPTIKQLVTPFWGYGASVAGPYDGMSFFMGTINWLALLVGFIFLVIFQRKFSKVEKILLWWGYGVFLLAFIMMNYRSTFLWKILPELPYFQFPWRFLILTTFVTPLFLIVLEKTKYSRQIGLGLIVIIISLNAFQFRPHDFLGRTDSYYLDRYVPFPTATESYKLTQEEYLRLSKDNQKRPDQVYPTFFSTTPMVYEEFQSNPLHVKAKISSNVPNQVSFNKYNFPGWITKVDGKEVEHNSAQPYGQINFPLPPGSHEVEVIFQETSLKLFLDLASFFAFLAALFILLPEKWSRFKRV